jgi:hypothetical protein
MDPATPPRKEVSTLKAVAIAIGWLFAGLTTIVFAIGAFAAFFDRPSQNGGPSTELRRILIHQDSDGFVVCPSQPLTDCSIRYGSIEQRDINFSRISIRAIASCDAQRHEAYVDCTSSVDAALDIFACSARWGIIGKELGTRGDPRDEHLPPGQFELRCLEGTKSGTFPDPSF